MNIECYEDNCNHPVCEYKSFCPKRLEEHDKQIRTDAIEEFDKALRTNTLMSNWCYQLVRSVKKDLLKEHKNE